MRPSLAKYCLIYPTHFVRKEWVPFYRREISRLDFISSSDFKIYQEKKLGQLLKSCQRDPYYSSIFKQMRFSFNHSEIFDNLKNMPFLTKEIVVSEEFKRRHKFYQFLEHRSTSGSTGRPFSFWKDKFSTGYMQAVQDHAYSWHNIHVGERQGRFWGMPLGRAGQISCLKDYLKNRIRFSAFDLSDQAKNTFYKKILRFRPSYLYGYPSLILEFGKYLDVNNLKLDKIPLRAVIGTGEYTFSHERDEIEHLIGVPFFSEYGCTEIGVIGMECPYGNMHLMGANVFLEVVDSNGKPVPCGEEGEFVVTELNSRYFPFVRYRLGDRGRFSGEICPCGRILPVFVVSAGRKDDFIITPDGRKIYDAIFAYTLKEGVDQFMAVQDRIDRIRIYVRLNKKFNDTLQKYYVKQLELAVSKDIIFDFVPVEELNRAKSGKLSYFKSDISRDLL